MPIDQFPQLIEALSTLAGVLDGLGIPGLLALAAAGPAAVIVALIYLNHINTKSLATMLEAYRGDMQAERKEVALLIERHRSDNQIILRDLENKHGEVVQYYRNNVELVRSYQRTAETLQSLVVNNTRVVERLTVIVEAKRHE